MHACRSTLEDPTDLIGRKIRKGDKVIMWYASANRDESVFPDADKLIIDRPNARDHLSFGFGIHRCMGARLAALQVKMLIEEMIKRRMVVEMVGPPTRVNFGWGINGFTHVPVKIRID